MYTLHVQFFSKLFEIEGVHVGILSIEWLLIMQAEERRTLSLDELLSQEELTHTQRKTLHEVYDALNGVQPAPVVTNLDEAVVDSYANHVDCKTVAKELGIPTGRVREVLHKDHVRELAQQRLKERRERSELSADYVREFIFGLLELCPTDYFTLAGDGRTWCVDPHHFNAIPKEIKRFVESVEMKRVAGEWTLVVKFMSKSAALALAARYSLVEKHEHLHGVGFVPWDAIARDVVPLNAMDILEAAKADAANRPGDPAGPAETDPVLLAGSSAVRQADRDSEIGVGERQDSGACGAQAG